MNYKTKLYDELIIGAGPAGLTAGYELVKSGKTNFLILEKNSYVGGLASTKVFGDFRYDIGPHRFFTKNPEIDNLFLKILENDAIKVNRLTRILYNKKYFNYPLTPFNALFGLGVLNSIQILFSYFYSRLKSYLKVSKIESFEDWIIDRFGKKLYLNFFKNYTEKVWGIECKNIGKDWASQRIKGLNLSSAIKNAFFPNKKNRPKSLIDSFYYPNLGAGMLWEKFENFINNNGVKVNKEATVIEIFQKETHYEVVYKNKDGKLITIKTKTIFFSNPLLQFIDIFKVKIPKNVLNAANKLSYRNHISVHICIDKKLFNDNWIYIHSPEIKAARISDFTNFSSNMAPKNRYTLTIEYFCFETENIWLLDENRLVELASKELRAIFNTDFEIVHSAVSKNRNAYPVISAGYQEHIEVIKKWIQKYSNIYPIGRSGMFKYNNQDHAMATAISAIRRYSGDLTYNPWNVNIDGEYHEISNLN